MAYPNQLPPPPPPQTMGSTNTVFITETRFDPSYVKTLPGIIKVVVIVSIALHLVILYLDCVRIGVMFPRTKRRHKLLLPLFTLKKIVLKG